VILGLQCLRITNTACGGEQRSSLDRLYSITKATVAAVPTVAWCRPAMRGDTAMGSAPAGRAGQ